MKKQKRKAAAADSSEATAPQSKPFVWWPWAAALVAVIVAFEVYGPALNGAFVFDDRILPFMTPGVERQPWTYWIGTVRPLLMLSFWLDFSRSGLESATYHTTNLILHLLNSFLVALIAGRLCSWAGVEEKKRNVLGVFCGALFLLHPLQTESVAYVASRSEALSIFFFYSAFSVFLYREEAGMGLPRTLAILALFAAAAVTKEHTVVLPALILIADYFWDRGGVRKNAILYGALAVAGAIGGAFVVNVLSRSGTAGFNTAGRTPLTYFFTQCRVIWSYIRFFFLPTGQNLDPDVEISATLFDHGAIVGLLGLVALLAAALFFRKRFPLASFGVITFLLLLAPTSSFVPIFDVQAEHRMYLPFLGLTLVAAEALRRLEAKQIAGIAAVVLTACAVLTYHRNQVWATPLTLWQDTAAKSPKKWRPLFQLGYAYYESGRCQEAAQSYEAAAKTGTQTYELLSDWTIALDCAGRVSDAIPKMQEALRFENNAHGHAVLGSLFAKTNMRDEALAELQIAQNLDPKFEMTYVYRGIVYELGGDKTAAAAEYQQALRINPSNQAAREALARATR
ncbi:MAG: tetratricopeptide repeat protein [Bryobacteraceae bacterium]